MPAFRFAPGCADRVARLGLDRGDETTVGARHPRALARHPARVVVDLFLELVKAIDELLVRVLGVGAPADAVEHFAPRHRSLVGLAVERALAVAAASDRRPDSPQASHARSDQSGSYARRDVQPEDVGGDEAHTQSEANSRYDRT